MSFASDVKEEVARIDLPENCKKAMLSALLQCLGSIGLSSSGLSLSLKVSNGIIARRIAEDIKSLYDIRCDIVMTKQQNLDKLNYYNITISEKTKDILGDLDLWTERGLQEHPRLMFLNSDDMMRSYLAGCFLASGSVNDPKSTQYHLELKANNERHADFIVKLLEKFFLSSKVTIRRGHSIVYIKSGDQISSFLSVIGAHKALMDYEDVRIQRDFMNSLTRLDNIKIANEQKIQAVADKQYVAVLFLKENNLLKLLSEKDREIALLRLEHPESSLAELAEHYEATTGQPLTKSGIRHRFEKIMALKEKYDISGDK